MYRFKDVSRRKFSKKTSSQNTPSTRIYGAYPEGGEVPISPLLSENDVSHYFKLTVSWLRKTRREGGGPSFYKIGRMVRYRLSDCEEFLNQQTALPGGKVGR